MLQGNTLALPWRALGRRCCCLRAASTGAVGQAASVSPGKIGSLSGQQQHLQLGKAPAMKLTFTLAWFLTTASSSGADPGKENQATQLPGSAGRDPCCSPNYLQWITGWPTSSVGCPLYKTHLIHNFKNFHLLKWQPICSSLTMYKRFCTEVISDKQ